MLLHQLIGKPGSSNVKSPSRVQSASRKREPQDEAETDSRCVQVKAAVRRSEKPVFEELAIKRETTLSDLIRDYLITEAKNAGLL